VQPVVIVRVVALIVDERLERILERRMFRLAKCEPLSGMQIRAMTGAFNERAKAGSVSAYLSLLRLDCADHCIVVLPIGIQGETLVVPLPIIFGCDLLGLVQYFLHSFLLDSEVVRVRVFVIPRHILLRNIKNSASHHVRS
jgi:hypothetical protein